MNYLTLLLVFLLSFSSYPGLNAQLSSVNIAGELFSGRIAYYKENKSEAILGSTYISEDWMIGSIVTKSGYKGEGLFRLNALKKEIEMIAGTDTVVLNETFDIEKVMLGGLMFISSITIDKSSAKRFNLNTHFLNLLADGRVQLLKKFKVGSYHNLFVPYYMGGAGDGRMHYRMGVSYYYRVNDGSAAYRLKRDNKTIASIYGVPKGRIKDIVQSNKFNLQKEEDLITLFVILNSENE